MSTKTPEQIAEYKAIALVVQEAMGCQRLRRVRSLIGHIRQPVIEDYCHRHGGAGWPCANAQQVTAAVAQHAAAREAQQAPEFKPEGEYDYYRTQWGKVDNPEATSLVLVITARDMDGERDRGKTHGLNITPEQAEHILKYLSETTED